MSYNGTITLTQPAAQRVFQRETRTGSLFGLGAGTVGLTINLSAPASLIEYQLRDANAPTTVITPWSTVATGLPSGPQVLNLSVPATTAWYLIDLRANSDQTSVVSTSNKVGVGEVVAAAGQSLATDFWSNAANGDSTTLAALGVNVTPYGSALAAWDGGSLPTSATAWAIPSDSGPYLSTFAAEFLRLLVFATGVNAALV